MSRRSPLGLVVAIGIGMAGLAGCGRTARTPQPTAAPKASPSAPSTPGTSSGRVVSASRFQARPCAGDTAIPADADPILDELGSPTREHCELHALTAGGPQLLFVRTMNTVAHDEAGDPIPTCLWEVLAIPPRPVEHLGTLSLCQFAIDDGCIYDLDQTLAPSAPTACIGADGRLVEPGR